MAFAVNATNVLKTPRIATIKSLCLNVGFERHDGVVLGYSWLYHYFRGLKSDQTQANAQWIFYTLTGIIFEHNGTIDKYVGDMVMAFWNAPLLDANHAEHAIDAALSMLQKVEELKITSAKGLPEVNIGVGINTGFMNVGDMGSVYRRTYTVLGDAVNLGSRLESITKFYGVKLLVGEGTYDLAPQFLYRLVDKIIVKGKREPVCV